MRSLRNICAWHNCIKSNNQRRNYSTREGQMRCCETPFNLPNVKLWRLGLFLTPRIVNTRRGPPEALAWFLAQCPSLLWRNGCLCDYPRKWLCFVPLCLSSSWLTRRLQCAHSWTTAGHLFPCWSTSSPSAITSTTTPGRKRPRDSASPPWQKYEFAAAAAAAWPLIELQRPTN